MPFLFTMRQADKGSHYTKSNRLRTHIYDTPTKQKDVSTNNCWPFNKINYVSRKIGNNRTNNCSSDGAKNVTGTAIQ
jgi:hypothetical protein